ncbi:MAG: hypothetical protein JSV41_00765, partial [Gemmatimonadota bacterium]
PTSASNWRRDAAVRPALDRGGQPVEMEVAGTIPKYSHYYISDKAYALLAERAWTGSALRVRTEN